MATSLVDAPDGQRRVETGVGIVEKIERKDGARNAQVTINATHLRLPVTGWADTHDGELLERLEVALTTKQAVEYRVETKRKAKVDPRIPLDDVDKYDRVRDLVGVRFAGATHPPAAPPDPSPADPPDTSPVDGRRQPSPGDRRDPSPPPATSTRRQSRNANRGTRNAEPPPAPTIPDHPEFHDGNPEDDAPPAGVGLVPGGAYALIDGVELVPVPPPPGKGPRLAEAKPWEPLNTDGSPNLGSYEVTASLAMVEWAHDLLLARGLETWTLAAEAAGLPTDRRHWHPEPMALRLDQVRGLARYLLQAADAAQAAIRDDGRVDRMDASHTRARGAVRTALDLYPVPWGSGKEDRQAWVQALASHAAALIRLALELNR